ncbi:MAG: stage V sporulation protein SpoVM [Clostridia bacterium]|nr:stage V sporulation protein SpoVM [Clostridia bacterium]MBR2952928.1 stage V sporulation protein SpoVM [Clostridia bacterium]
MEYLFAGVRGGLFMKVVVMKSPKFLGGILRKLFGIPKTEIQ